MKKLIFTNNSGYPCQNNNWGLAWIDKRDLTVESRQSEDDGLKRYGYFRSCLEEWNNLFEESCKSVIYYHVLNTENLNFTKNIADFLAIIETKLNLKNKSEVFDTDKQNLTPIRVAPFWLKNKLKRWTFSLIVRDAARHFNKDAGISSVISNANCHSKCVESFLNLFLDGYTKFDQKCLDKVYASMRAGPIFQFKNLQPEQIKDVLMFKEEVLVG